MLNEFRQDLVSGEWVLFATGRAKRPRSKVQGQGEFYQPKDSCPFEDPKSTHEVMGGYPSVDDWKILVIRNKYPAVIPGVCAPESSFGPFNIHTAVGEHDILVFKDHEKPIDLLSQDELAEVINAYKHRYRELTKNEGCAKYISIFHNHGYESGASISHPHSQIISTPILPPDVAHSILGASRYYKKYKKRVYDLLLEWELKEGKRIIYDSKDFIAFCPFVSKYPYEIRIFSKESHAHFDKMPDELNMSLAETLETVFYKLRKVLGDPSFNFFVHTAPLENGFDEDLHEFYHWHLEIVPHFKIDAGFEMGTGVEVNTIDPDEAAEALRKI